MRRSLLAKLQRPALVVAFVAALGFGASAQTPAPPSLHMRALTWPEVKAAIESGYTSVLVPSGGIEQNGPHMVLQKHDIIVGAAAERIAADVGGMLVAPTLSIVPEGDFDPPSGNMRFPGTIGITPAAYEGVLDGVARSLKRAGFKAIFFIGDHGQSQQPQQNVADRLTREWQGEGVKVFQVTAYYDDAEQNKALAARGISPAVIGFHAGLVDTAEVMALMPEAVRPEAIKALPKTLPKALAELGASGDPAQANAALGREMLAMRVAAASARIRSLLGSR